MKRAGAHHLGFASYDYDATIDFYTRVLSWQIAWQDLMTAPDGTPMMKHVFFDTGDGSYVAVMCPTPEMPNHPKNTRSQHLWIYDQTGEEIASAHYYVSPTGPVTPLDPKAIKIGGIRYVIHPNPLIANPEHALPFVWMRKVYGWIRRKIICPAFGPLDVLP